MASIDSNQAARTGHSWRIIEAAREAVTVIDLADRLVAENGGTWRRVGTEWVTNCVLPDHADRVPSFSVNPESNLWYCHGCARGGDCVRLACFLLGIVPRSREEESAAAWVLHEFGYDIPERPPTWYAKQKRQKEARAAFSRVRVGATQRRVYELLRRDQEALGNPDPTEGEREYMWLGAGHIASLLIGDRQNRAKRGAA